MDKLLNIFNKSKNYIVIYQLYEDDVKVKFANISYCELFNIKYKDICGSSIFDYLENFDIDIEKLKIKINTCVNENQNFQYIRHICVDGKDLFMNVSMFPYYEKNETYIFENAWEINQLSNNKIMLNGHNTIYKVENDCNSNAYFLVKYSNDGNLICENCNTTFENLVRKDFKNIIGQPIDKLLKMDNLIIENASKCVKAQETIKYSIRYDNLDEERYLEITLVPTLIDEQQMIYATVRDITDTEIIKRKNMELLKKYNSLLDLSYNAIACITFDEDKGFNIESGNKEYWEFNKIYMKYHHSKIKSDTIKQIFYYKNPKRIQLKIDLENDEYIHYSVTIIPISTGSKVRKILVSITNTTDIFGLQRVRQKSLTKREDEILDLVAQGYTNKYIAKYLGITEGTVKKHIYNAYSKLGICSRVELVKIYFTDSKDKKL